MIVHRTTGVVDKQHSPAVLFATVKGAYGISLKSFILRLLHCISALLWAVPVVHTQLFPIVGGGWSWWVSGLVGGLVPSF